MVHEHELTRNAVAKGQILIVSTSHDKLGDTGELTGTWLEEVAAPYEVFRRAGYDVTIASIKGGKIPVDAASLAENAQTDATRRFSSDDLAKQSLEHSVPLDSIHDHTFYEAIFLPGGHGVCWDVAYSDKLASLLSDAYAAGKVVSAVCHGPVGLTKPVLPDGKPLVAGKRVTGFSDSEEDAVGKSALVPFSLEQKLKELGGVYSSGPNWAEYVVVDERLVTGQNPASSHAVGVEVVKLLQK